MIKNYTFSPPAPLPSFPPHHSHHLSLAPTLLLRTNLHAFIAMVEQPLLLLSSKSLQKRILFLPISGSQVSTMFLAYLMVTILYKFMYKCVT